MTRRFRHEMSLSQIKRSTRTTLAHYTRIADRVHNARNLMYTANTLALAYKSRTASQSFLTSGKLHIDTANIYADLMHTMHACANVQVERWRRRVLQISSCKFQVLQISS